MRVWFGTLAVIFVVLAGTAQAQTTPTFGEGQVGVTPCYKGASSADFDTLAQCTSTGATAGTFQKAPLFVGAVTSPPYAATTCDTNKSGMIQYDGTNPKYCDGTAWQIIPSKDYVDAAGGGGTWYSQTFTASGTWTKPANAKTVNVLLVGGGGGGGGAYSSSASGGGGGGCITIANEIPVSGNLTVTIGTGGIAGLANQTSSAGNGANGGATKITDGTVTIAAAGGQGGWITSSYQYQAGAGGGNNKGASSWPYYNGTELSYNRMSYKLTNAESVPTATCAGGGGGGGVYDGASVYGQAAAGGLNSLSHYVGGTVASCDSYVHSGGGGGAGYGGNGGNGSQASGQAGQGYGAGGGGGGYYGGTSISSPGGAGYAGYAIIYWQE